MNDEFKGILKEAAVPQPTYYPRLFLDGLRKTKKNISQHSWRSGRDTKQVLSEYVSRPTPATSVRYSYRLYTLITIQFKINICK
jgi:hypothetical protein